MSNTFEDATRATEEMFAENSRVQESTPQQEEPTAPQAEQESNTAPAQQSEEQAVIDDSVKTAEAAAQAAADMNTQLQQAMAQIQSLQAQNSQLQGAVDELSKRNEQNIIEKALEPPILDISALSFADDDTIRAAQEKYASDMSEYTRSQIMKELSPFIAQAKEGMREKEEREALSVLSGIPELSGIEGMLPQLESIIQNNKALSSDDMSMDEKLITAYAIAKGVNSITAAPPEKKEPTTEELMDLYNSNPAFQEMVEKQRIEQLKQSQQVPPFSASSGAVNAALNIKEEPKGWDDASKRTREMFGLK